MVNREELNRAIREKWGYTQIAEENRCSVEEVKTYIETLSRQEKRFFKKHLDSNEGRFLKNQKKTVSNQIEGDDIETLKRKREKLMEVAILHELERESILDSRRGLKKELSNIKEEQLKLQKQLEETLKRMSEICEVLDTTAEELEVINSKIIPNKEEIDKLTTQIALLEKKTIKVDSSGTIELDEEIIIPDEWEKYYNDFLNSNGISAEVDAILEDFTRKEIKGLAKLIAITNAFISADQKFEVDFNNENIKRIYSFFG